MRSMRCIALAVALACAGCAVGPDYRAPEPEGAALAPFAGADADLFRQEAPQHDWWRLYDDPVLDAAIGEALEANTDLRRAAANLARASALLAETRGTWLPTTTFGAGSTTGRQNFPQQGFAFEDTIYEVGFDVSYQLDLVGRIRRAIEAAKAEAEAVEALYQTVQITVAAETARAYVAACAARLELAAAERSLALQRETEALTQRLFEAGRGTALDVARASAAVEQTRASIPTLEAQHRNALYRLAVLMGRAPTDFPPEAAECRTPPVLDAPIAVGDGAALLARRPDIREAERRLAAATARIGVATADLYPSVSLAGSTGAVALAASDLDSSDASRWTFGPLLRFTFPNRTIARARLAQAEADAEAALAAFDGAWFNALREVEGALVDYAKELERRDALTAARNHAEDAVRLARARFDAGQVSFLDVLQADLALAEAEMALARSAAETARFEVALFLALGGGWSER